MISYCIPVCNEHIELKLLLGQISKYLKDGDEIIVQGDQGNVTTQVVSVISPLMKRDYFTYIEYPLNGDFASFKNNMLKYAKNPWVFQIDADELVSEFLFDTLNVLTDSYLNPDIEAWAIPRVNIVKGLTQEWITKWGWYVKKKRIHKNDSSTNNVLELAGVESRNLEIINYPDYQVRLFKNNGEIYWKNKVHEVLTKEHKSPIIAPLFSKDEDGVDHFGYALFHIKNIDRQVRQNEMYDKIKP